jgi:hypothetical protein
LIARRYVRGIKISGLQVSTAGLTLTIQPGSITVAEQTVALKEAVTLEFPTSDKVADVQIGFDLFGRLYVDRYVRGEPREERRFAVLTHYIHFTLPPGTTDLASVMVHVLCEPPA